MMCVIYSGFDTLTESEKLYTAEGKTEGERLQSASECAFEHTATNIIL
jgi:hypothetical protein